MVRKRKRPAIRLRPVEGRQTVESRSEDRDQRRRPEAIGTRYQTDADSAGREELVVPPQKKKDVVPKICPVCFFSTWDQTMTACPKCENSGLIGGKEEA